MRVCVGIRPGRCEDGFIRRLPRAGHVTGRLQLPNSRNSNRWNRADSHIMNRWNRV
jgi:hypothetical protein